MLFFREQPTGTTLCYAGFIYVLRGREKSSSLSMGLHSLIVTFTICLPILPTGIYLLDTGLLDSFQIKSSVILISTLDYLVNPVINLATEYLPNWLIFLLGLVVIMVSFSLIENLLPISTLKDTKGLGCLSYRSNPLGMFLVGAVVTLLTLSVSLSLSILVPLHDRGYIRRESAIPYIMGASITTFVDTMAAAVLLNNQTAFTIVFVNMLEITFISILILSIFYNFYREIIQKTIDWIISNNRNIYLFLFIFLVTPIIILFFAPDCSYATTPSLCVNHITKELHWFEEDIIGIGWEPQGEGDERLKRLETNYLKQGYKYSKFPFKIEFLIVLFVVSIAAVSYKLIRRILKCKKNTGTPQSRFL